MGRKIWTTWVIIFVSIVLINLRNQTATTQENWYHRTDLEAHGNKDKLRGTESIPSAWSDEKRKVLDDHNIVLGKLWDKISSDADASESGFSSLVLANFFNFNTLGSTLSEEISLVTHGSADKLNNILTQLEYWNGPSSIAFYITNGTTQIHQLVQFVMSHEATLQNATIHLYMECQQGNNTLGYPHNILRNIAMDHSRSDFVVAADGDLVPGPPNCHESLLRTLHAKNNEIESLMRQKQFVMILPSFDIFPLEGEVYATPNQIPQNKTALKRLMTEKRAEPFRFSRFRAGHAPTLFNEWKTYDGMLEKEIGTENDADVVTFYNVKYRDGFEPFVMVYRPGLPRYWTHFRGYGSNKVSWFMELHRAGYEFATLTQQYFVHLSHPSTKNIEERRVNVRAKFKFVEYLNERYPLEGDVRMPNNKTFYHF